jgi:hypothetical protein
MRCAASHWSDTFHKYIMKVVANGVVQAVEGLPSKREALMLF